MSWRAPDPYEISALENVKEDCPEIITLAKHLILAPRIEPLLLRNARLHFTSRLQAEVESQLWFSPLVAARSNTEIILHQGIASALANTWFSNGDNKADRLNPIWQFTYSHTRHWEAADRLERDLRYYALIDDERGVKNGLDEILKRLHADIDEEEQIELSRLTKRTLPVITHKGQKTDEARILAQFSSQVLGDSNSWFNPGEPQSLPASLAEKLPEAISTSSLQAEVHEDSENGQVIYFTDAEESSPAIHFPTALPTRLHIKPAGQAGEWHSVSIDSRIKITPPAINFRLTTIEGKQWDLSAALHQPTDQDETETASPPPLILSYFKADHETAMDIANWLEKRQIPYELHEESEKTAYATMQTEASGVVRLWSRNSEKYWANQRTDQQSQPLPPSLLLRVDDSELPGDGTGKANVLQWPGADRFDSPEQDAKMQQQLQDWLKGGEFESLDVEAYAENSQTDPQALETEMPATELTIWLCWAIDGEEWMWSIRKQLESNGINCIDESTVAPQKMPDEALLSSAMLRADAVFVIHHPDTRPLMKGDKRIEQADTARRYLLPVYHVESEGRINTNALYQENEDIFSIEEIGSMTVQGLQQTLQGWRERQTQTLLDKLADPTIEPKERLAAGDELARLGDPRPGVGLDADGLPDIDWVEIPEGEFLYGEEKQPASIASFYMARYPITNAQYEAFIKGGGYDDKRWWQGLSKRTKTPRETSWNQGNRPRETVSWYEAVAYCRWLGDQMGYEVALPTEQQWERAASGSDGRDYPWGNEYQPGYANIDEKGGTAGPNYLQETSTVGMYGFAGSPEGIQDLSGNVWEWVLNDYNNPDNTSSVEGKAPRVLRGGSWLDGPDYAQASLRFGYGPDYRDYSVGFRVVCSSPIKH